MENSIEPAPQATALRERPPSSTPAETSATPPRSGESASASSPSPEPSTPQEAETITRELEHETDEARRIELIYALAANSTDTARSNLAQFYHVTSDARLKVEIIQSLTFIDSENLAPSLPLLLDAVAPGQALDLRTAAAAAARDLNSPKTMPVWQALLADPSPELREAAKSAIEYLALFDVAR